MMEEPKRHSTDSCPRHTLHTANPAPFAKRSGVESVSQSGPRCGSDAWAMIVSSRRSVLVPRCLSQDLRWCHQLTHSCACQNLRVIVVQSRSACGSEPPSLRAQRHPWQPRRTSSAPTDKAPFASIHAPKVKKKRVRHA